MNDIWYKEFQWYKQDRELQEWISDVKRELLFGDYGKYDTRSKLQRKLMNLENVRINLRKTHFSRRR